MALSTMASWAVSTIAASVVENLVSTGYSYLLDRMLPADSEAELKRLQATLPQIRAVMGIAEALKMKDPNTSEWVEQFRQAVEASEDVLDELEYKKLEDMVKKRDEVGGSASRSKKRKPCTINDDILERLKGAITMLDRAAAGVEPLLQLATTIGIRDISQSWQEAVKVLNRETTSFLAERKVFGREVEKQKIIDWLKRPTDARVASFGIVGVGGQGKTTLVQFAYQEMCWSNHFDKTIWVCVSTNFSVEDITRKMLGELGENSCSGKPLNALQETLKEKIHSKKVLLVLDDVWDEKRREWEQLIAPLRFVQQGSKILFTTRMKSVANLLASVISTEHESLALQGLGEQELQLLFYSYAFHGSSPNNHRDLQAIGDQILEMLRGSPLAAKVIGSLLNSRMDHQYWTRILNHGSLFNLEQAKDVVEVLKLSYYHLPANLQVCFRFCSIFPQDHKFDKDELIKMWIASGFIPQQSSQEESLEDIGEDYFNLLLRKSFFEYSYSYQRKTYYIMHDLMHELAQNMSHGECCRIESNNIPLTIPSSVRHVSVHDDSEIDRVSHLGNLRSLIIFPSRKRDLFVLPNNLIKKPLRLLKIEEYRTLELPEEISCLVHLRYLSIEPISKKQYSLLASISTLYHLQVLEFPTDDDNSSDLGIETTGMTNLLRLRYMSLPQEIMQTIHGVHKLTSLQELTFFIGKEIGYRINELGTLNNLRHLSIKNIENVGDPAETKSANLLEKNNLMSLSLKWTSESNPNNSEQIIDHLQPHPNLMGLTIHNYNGQRSPNWMEESPAPLNLSFLQLLNCPLWKNQLFSGKIPFLKILLIRDCLNMDKLPDMSLSLIEFYIYNVGLSALPEYYQSSDSSGGPSTSSLIEVQIHNCQNLTSLNGFLQQDNIDFQSIKKIRVSNCKNLVHLPMGAFGKFVSLQRLQIWDCPMLMGIDNQSTLLPTALKDLSIENCGKVDEPLLESASSLPTLTNLSIKNCANISHIPELPTSLRGLVIDSASSLKLLPATMARLTVLEKLKIWEANLLEELPELPTSLRELLINGASSLKSLPATMARLTVLEKLKIEGADLLEELPELPTSLRKLVINSASSLKLLPATIARLTALEKLKIEGANLLEELPELPTSLRELDIWNASSLKSLPATMARLTALERLEIGGANLLEELPELPTSLRELDIWNASSLKSLPATMARLTALERLEIGGANLLEELPELPTSLRELVIYSASSLKSLPATIARLTALRFLIIWGANLLEELPELPTSLRKLLINGASSLKSLPATMARLTALERLEIGGANLLEELPELSTSLRELDIWNASSLKSLPATMARLTALERLEIGGANLLEELPELPTSLRELLINGASSLKSLPATMTRLTALEELEIWGANLLEELPELPASLKEKKIEGRGGRLL